MKQKTLKYTSLVLGIILTVTLIVNTSVTTFVLWNDRQTASMSPNARENLNINVEADLGRPSPLRYFWDQLKSWTTAWYVEGVESTDSISGLTITVTGSNVGSQASVSYYIEAVASDASGIPYRFLEGNGTSITVGGANLTPTNQTTIINHLEAMELSTTASHIIDYYVYVKAQATGAVSGELLTSEIVKTKFDTVSYSYGAEVSDTFYATMGGQNFDWSTSYFEDLSTMQVRLKSNKEQHGFLFFPLTGIGEIVTEAELNARAQQIQDVPQDHTVYRITETWNTGGNKPTWNNQPTYSTTDTATIQPAEGWNTWDISEITQAWGGGADKFGVMLAVTGTPSGDHVHILYNYDGDFPPYIDVTWVDYAASWYQIPASVIDIPLSQELGTLLVVAISVGYILHDQTRRKEK